MSPSFRIQTRGFLTIATLAVAAVMTSEAGEPGSSGSGWPAGYPGPPPGRAIITCRGHDITVGNNAISMSWAWTHQGLHARTIRDVQTGTRLKFSGQVFQIVLTDGRRYAASGWSPDEARV